MTALRLLHPRELAAQRPPVVPAIRLLHPRELARESISATERAFGRGPQLHPNRAAFEFYPTPPEATQALLSMEAFDGTIWEPACGQGHISKVLASAGHEVISTDLVSYDYGIAGRDFLAERNPLAKHIVTNPPYGRGLADAFVKHAIALTQQSGGKVAMLLAINSLCHASRHMFWTTYPPARVYALDEVHCWPNGDERQATKSLKAQRYVWAIWEPHQGPTELHWLSTRQWRLSA